MSSWLLVLSTTCILVFALLRVSVYIDLHFCRKKDDDFVSVTVYALRRIFSYSIKIPVIKIKEYNDLPWISSEIKTTDDNTETHISGEQRFVKKLMKILFFDPQRFLHIYRTTNRFVKSFRSYIDKLSRNIHCEKFYVNVKYGFDDAAFTSIMIGVFGALVEKLLNSMRHRLILDTKPDVNLIPVFNKSHFEVELKCIFRIRLGNVITATIARIPKLLNREATRSG